MHYLLENIETLWEPKKVNTNMDWLATQKENGQPLKRYMQGGPEISWTNPRFKTILLFLIDDSIDDQTGQMMKLYCEAYFHGCDVQLVRPGDKLTEKTRGGATRTKKVPKDFIKHHNITARDNIFGP